MFLYPQAISNVYSKIESYRRGVISTIELQQSIRECEDTIVAVSERELSKKMRWAENEIETIIYTVDSALRHDRILSVIDHLEQYLHNWSESGNPLADFSAT